jgi:hypothetical protein
MDERRKFERVILPAAANIYAEDGEGRRIGRLRILGRGGFLMDTRLSFTIGTTHLLTIVAEGEGIRRSLPVVVRYGTEPGVGFEFVNLEPDAAVEVGVLLGKYYQAAAAS